MDRKYELLNKEYVLVKLFVFIFCTTLFWQTSFCQQNNLSVWNTIQLPITLSSKWQIHNDISYRTIGFSTAAFQYTFRHGVRYFINKKWNIAAGFAQFNTRTKFDRKENYFGKENRLWQEIVHEKKISPKFTLLHRFRIEERFFSATKNTDPFTAIRCRYRLAFQQSITNKWKLQLFDEYMQQLQNGDFNFQQNRLGTTAIFSFDKLTQMQLGYIWSKQKTSNLHFITCTFTKNIHLHGTTKK
jgi:Protein of unknown function (DUF2490)